MTLTRLTGWGRTARTVADLRRRGEAPEVRDLVVDSALRGAVARGLGRAYGAAAQNSGGIVVDMCVPDTDGIDLDASTGIVTVDAGVSFDDLLKYSVPKGWFVPVTPGTRFVTVGGAIASDVHGKNHHFDGSFGNHLFSLDLLMSDGREVRLSPETTAEWFWATVGGMGLTGIILRATFKMLRITSSKVKVETIRFPDLVSGLELMSDARDDDFRYSVAWIDISARGKHLGRGILTRGDHADASDDDRSDSLAYNPKIWLSVPPFVPNGLINALTIRIFNELWFRRSPRKPHISLESIAAFFHPLDGVRNWNRVYGPGGFIQYQIIVPFEHTDVLREIISRMSKAHIGSFLAVLKRMGSSNGAPLSFPTEGWTLTVDISTRTRGLSELLAELDEMVLRVGGRHYLAKDAHVTAAAVARAYPRFAEWKATREKMDPDHKWKSDLGRRLGLVK